MQEKVQFLTCVCCITYNHAAYIEDAMNGFCMQNTSFPYVCVIVDDASTDGALEVIKKYLEENFELKDKSIVRNEETNDFVMIFAQHKTNLNCFFAVYCLKYNHYSIKKSKKSYYSEWSNAKYIALCEGDDYWICSEKLERQISKLEKHPDIVMTCSRAKRYSQRRKQVVEDLFCYEQSKNVEVKDVILRGGGFIPSCSIVYRNNVKQDYPDYCLKCHIGDWPLQIMCSMRGTVYYDNDAMVVYRIDNPFSWTGRNSKVSFENWLKGIKSEIVMLLGFAHDNPSYYLIFKEKADDIISYNVPIKILKKKEYSEYILQFRNEIDNFDSKHKIVFKQQSSLLFHVYRKIFSVLSK